MMGRRRKYLSALGQDATIKLTPVGLSVSVNTVTSLILITTDGYMQERKGAVMLIQNLKYSTEEMLRLRSMIGSLNARPARQSVL